jgi:hypothetical protein
MIISFSTLFVQGLTATGPDRLKYRQSWYSAQLICSTAELSGLN